MRGRGSFKVLVTGLVMGGVLLSQGCFLGWLKEKTACSHCHKCPNSTGKQHDKNSAGEAENKGDGYASREVYSVEVEPSKGGRPMVKFGAASNTEIKLTLCNPKLLTTEGVKDKVMAMIGQMVPRGLNFNDFPQQQVKMLLEDLVKIECLRRTEIKGLLEQEEFRKKLAQKVEVDLNALVFEHVINQVKDKVIISDEEVAEEYRENLGKYIKELGGVRLVAAKYSTLEEAQQELAALMDKGVSTIPDFTEEIKESAGQLRDFGIISGEFPRGADKALVEAAEGFTEYPSVDMVTVSGDEHWVLLATELKETVYYKFDECKTHIAEALKQRAMEKVLGEYIEKAKSNVDVEIVSTSLREDGNENSDDNHLDHDHSSVLHDEDMPTQAEAGFGEEAEADDFAEEMAQKR